MAVTESRIFLGGFACGLLEHDAM